ncbi:MAG TPA: PEP-CTERM sorting domain-containing protein [Chthoniobacteraceae bacterium]|jgi:hypothetical protein
MIHSSNHLALAILALSGLAVAPASAANPGFAFGDLILGFQTTGTGNESFVLYNLGNAGTLRNATSNLAFGNLNSALAAQFGVGWQDRTDLYMGAATVWDVDPFNETLLNGDPAYTLYVSSSRVSPGTAGTAQSQPYVLTENARGTAGDAIFGAATDYENRGSAAASTLTNAGSFIDWVDQNPIGAGGVQGTAFGTFPAGIQTTFGPGTYGSLGGGLVEAALDLFRVQNRNDIPGQAGFGAANGVGTFEGSIVIDGMGLVSFVVVPEPSSAALISLGAIFAGCLRRRRSAPVI